MLISPEYCRLMARYNRWQNDGYRALVGPMPLAEALCERGVFWGSILGTLNHLLCGDLMWMGRFDGGPSPRPSGKKSGGLCPTPEVWAEERLAADSRILAWAEGLTEGELSGGTRWTPGGPMRPLAPLVVHFFNHQTHHRGQVHAMLTAAGLSPPDTDLFLMPK